ncbi:hypothetical protein GWI33_003099 [Rhynchophorus ferrugineus]|uniref:Uncharacterized protein n=1 Tax=Rhynchophorus ferrugineus TaxID=354439 RepID=A0A834IQG8_RHYFE|nr:hypothetical protein GWI33_003099 [Rhynchophorus ferrugineus]
MRHLIFIEWHSLRTALRHIPKTQTRSGRSRRLPVESHRIEGSCRLIRTSFRNLKIQISARDATQRDARVAAGKLPGGGGGSARGDRAAARGRGSRDGRKGRSRCINSIGPTRENPIMPYTDIQLGKPWYFIRGS